MREKKLPMSIGRNDPCPCGSGKKYKKCCLALAEFKPLVLSPKERAEILGQADLELYARLITKLAAAGRVVEPFIKSLGFPDMLSVDEDTSSFLSSWMLYHLPVDGETIGGRFYQGQIRRLDDSTRKLLEAHLESHLTVWQVVSVDPERGLALRDGLLGDEIFVEDVEMAQTLQVHAGLLGTFLRVDDLTIVGALHPNYVSPGDLHALIGKIGTTLSREGLRGGDAGERLIRLWFETLRQPDETPDVKLTNTEGHSLKWVEDRYSFDPAEFDDVFDALLGVDEVIVKTPRFLEFREESKSEPTLDLVFATVEMLDDGLLARSNSVKRANRVRKLLEDQCPSLERGRRKIYDVDPNPASRLAKHFPDTVLDPLVELALKKARQDMNRRWLDLLNPRLGGLAPREAVQTAAGAAEVDKMLQEFEFRGDPPEDIRALRRELGV